MPGAQSALYYVKVSYFFFFFFTKQASPSLLVVLVTFCHIFNIANDSSTRAQNKNIWQIPCFLLTEMYVFFSAS